MGACYQPFASLSLQQEASSAERLALNINVFVLGVANGSFAVAAIGGMMMLAAKAAPSAMA